ncbi:hypothetical protein F2Q69_00048444 [Brassica cretica]|uniref:Retrotransposon gag domain-containing protein n=1 Tax=Brassica cretica TaxID=69181 RepID=A0A8S9PHB7_BRACR|nr:hypothetical protein F2Q69_00048444 [Brassica cretica]
MYPCKTMEDLLSRAWAQVKWEEDIASRAKAQPKQDHRSARSDRGDREERSSQKGSKDSGIRNRGRFQYRPQEKEEGMSVSTWPDISHLSILTPELVNALRQMGQQVKWPPKMKAPDSFWNPEFWCDFHRDHGRKTEDCIALRIEVNELLQKGHLREFLSEKAKAHLSKETAGNSKGAAPISPPRQDRVINVISVGSEVSGVSHAAAKKSTRNAKHGLEMTQSKLLLLGTDEISFTVKEQEKILAPHHDALVISLTVTNCLVKRILVDNGSSSNIIFQRSYQDLGLEESALTRKVTHLSDSAARGRPRSYSNYREDLGPLGPREPRDQRSMIRVVGGRSGEDGPRIIQRTRVILREPVSTAPHGLPRSPSKLHLLARPGLHRTLVLRLT